MNKYETIVQTRIDQLLGGDTIRYGNHVYKVVNTPTVDYVFGDGEQDMLSMRLTLDMGSITGPLVVHAFANDTVRKVVYDYDQLLADLETQ